MNEGRKEQRADIHPSAVCDSFGRINKDKQVGTNEWKKVGKK
jgi:hypothetical protein